MYSLHTVTLHCPRDWLPLRCRSNEASGDRPTNASEPRLTRSAREQRREEALAAPPPGGYLARGVANGVAPSVRSRAEVPLEEGRRSSHLRRVLRHQSPDTQHLRGRHPRERAREQLLFLPGLRDQHARDVQASRVRPGAASAKPRGAAGRWRKASSRRSARSTCTTERAVRSGSARERTRRSSSSV